MSKFILLIYVKYAICPMFLNVSLNSGYAKRKTSIGFFEDLGKVEGIEMILLLIFKICIPSVQSVSSVAQSCLTLCNPRDCSTPGLPVHHQLLEFTQTHVHWVSDVIQPSHPLSSPSPPAFNLSQHQGLFQWVTSWLQVAKVLEFQLQHQSFQWIFRTDFLYNGLVGSPCSPRDSQESSPTPQFKSINSSVLSFLYSPTLTSIHDYWKNHSFDWTDLCWQSNVSGF